ncbi:MAG TPA: phosphodiester glycosidase family protein [Thermoanaerobaculia bacterium]|nr:phosphodiester glycosidase family protein [Thermoanaerobaculia bacterium]
MRRLLLLLLFATSAFAQWRSVAPGVAHQRIGNVHVTRVDLKHANTKVIATAKSERGMTVSAFAKKHRAIVAVNGDYFDEQHWPIGKAGGACGVWWEGKRIARRQGLVSAGAGRVEIQRNTQSARGWARGAVSGWPLLVDGCKAERQIPGSDHFTRVKVPRTAVATSRDGKTLYLVVAEAMTLPELAQFLVRELGACRAMNLDGGMSSTMWVGNAVVAGSDIAVGNHLAVVGAADYSGCAERKSQ